MSTDVVTPNRDNDLKDETVTLIFLVVDLSSKLYLLLKTHQRQAGVMFMNDWCPAFYKLYLLTNDAVENRNPGDEKVKKVIDDTNYYLEGIMDLNGHRVSVDKINIINGIKLFENYKKELSRAGLGGFN